MVRYHYAYHFVLLSLTFGCRTSAQFAGESGSATGARTCTNGSTNPNCPSQPPPPQVTAANPAPTPPPTSTTPAQPPIQPSPPGEVTPPPPPLVLPPGPPPPPVTDCQASGNCTVNVPVTRVHVFVNVDHVTDFVVTATEMYAVHHQLGKPTYAKIELYGPDGSLINTQGWTMHFPKCPAYPKYDANCQSTRLTLTKGTSLTGNFTKVKGRGRAWLFNSNPITARVTDCGAADCAAYGAAGQTLAGPSDYEWWIQ